ncbi:MAG: ABC transporter ATP-binding protein [Treponema sp.]|nr:ABC transporter ATP-binding protein [Treponema sp.]
MSLELQALKAGYGPERGLARDVIPHIDITVEAGELLVVAGPNGSGKTTLLKTAAGLLRPLSGRVMVSGKDLHSLGIRERSGLTAFLFQLRDSPWPFTVRETIAQGCYARQGWLGSQTREDKQAVEGALEKAHLLDLAERPITELSGGELQRVYIARCIAQGAAFLLLDEPENNLDPKYAFMVMNLCAALVKEGRGAMISLHNLRLASRFAHRVALLGPQGNLIALGPPHEVLTEETLGRAYDLSSDLVRELIL